MWWLFKQFLGNRDSKNKAAEQSYHDAQVRYEDAELLDLDTPEMDEAYEQGYEDALEGRDFEDTSEEYAAGYEDAIDDIERSEESW